MSLNIYQRINEVRKKVSYVQKDKKIQNQYMAVTHDAVTAAVREHLCDGGIVIVPSLESSKVVETGTTTSSGVPIIRYEAMYGIAFVNMDDPNDKVVVRIESHALDQGDKAPGKAASYATKYAMLKLFSLETGEEEEERVPAKGKDKILTGSITPTTDCWSGVPRERHELLNRIAADVMTQAKEGNLQDAYDYLYTENLDAGKVDNDEFVCIWDCLKGESKIRNTLKKMRQDRQLAGAV